MNNPTNPMRPYFPLLTIALAALLAASAPHATAQNATTDEVGFITLDVEAADSGNAYNFLGLSMFREKVGFGIVESVNAAAIVVANANWEDDAFNNVAEPFVSHFLEVTSGPNRGLVVDIQDTTNGNTVTLTEDVSALISADDTICIRPHWTIATVFGETNEKANLDPGATASDSDNIVIYNPVSQSSTTYYFKNAGFTGGTGWRASDPSEDKSDTVIYPDQGFYLVLRDGSPATDLKLVGEVKKGPLISVVESGFNFLVNPFPVDTVTDTETSTVYEGVTLATSGLYTGDSNTGLDGGATAADADTVTIYNNTGTSPATYFYKNAGFTGGTGWRSTSASVSDPMDGVEIAAGASVIINRKDGGSPFSWIATHQLPALQ